MPQVGLFVDEGGPWEHIVCPGPDCPMCNGEACALCGAGCSNTDPARPVCEHDVIERHTEQTVVATTAPPLRPLGKETE